METPKTFLEKNENFVLKLRLVGIGGECVEIDQFRFPGWREILMRDVCTGFT